MDLLELDEEINIRSLFFKRIIYQFHRVDRLWHTVMQGYSSGKNDELLFYIFCLGNIPKNISYARCFNCVTKRILAQAIKMFTAFIKEIHTYFGQLPTKSQVSILLRLYISMLQ